MAKEDDKYNKKLIINEHEEGSEGESGEATGTGGQSGQIEFRDFLAAGERLRDDLSPEELKHWLAILTGDSEQRIKDQKNKRDQYTDLRNGKTQLHDFRAAMGRTDYSRHPILSEKFSGTDPQISPIPDANIADTNNDKRNELQYQYNLRHHPEYAPTHTFTPKLTPKGG